jgi:anaerobic selenocysteine-containing dehydrogenase
MRQGNPTRRGYLVAFEPHQSLTGANADEWIAIAPGSEGVLAAALARLVAEQRGGVTPELEAVDIAAASQASGVPEERLRSLAGRFAGSVAPVAIPGSGSLAHASGLATAEAILNLNVMANNLGVPGGLFLSPVDPLQVEAEPAADEPAQAAPGALSEVTGLVDRMTSGQVQVLFVHGANPLFELPRGLGFTEALSNVPLVISFASFPDETSRQADWVLPDHVALESWGYQRELAGTDRPTVSGMQPVVAPMYDTRATADVLLAASAGALPYTDEVAFLQQKIGMLSSQPGFYTASDPASFWALWLQNGGWWAAEPALQVPQGTGTAIPAVQASPAQDDPASFTLIPFTTILGDGSGANRPWLQETPNPLTTVMWNSWISIHPQTAARLGVTDDDVVTVTSPDGEVEAVVYRYPAIRPDTVAVPFGQGHTALGRYAEGRGFNPANLLGQQTNEAGDPSYADVRVTITPTGRKQHIGRLESKEGVYGEAFERRDESQESDSGTDTGQP